MLKPDLPLPVPYLCCDPGSFAENTLLVRLPEIARRVIAENQLPPEAVQRIDDLLLEMRSGQLRNLKDPGAPDEGLWQDYLQPYRGKSWRELSFLVCENVFYRRVLEACGYYQNGLEHNLDPYTLQKRTALNTSQTAITQLSQRLEAWKRSTPLEAFAEAIESNLWGNRADLSIWPAGAEGTLSNDALHQAEEYLLVNDLERLSQTLAGFHAARVDFLIDNAGFELVCDLALADLLLVLGAAREVHFHLKAHPTFVSDALVGDVRQTAVFLSSFEDPLPRELGIRLIEAISTGRLVLKENFFWNSPLPTWQMPGGLSSDLAGADLTISKGDAHFRRLLGDLRWEETTSFSRATSYFPSPLAALRVAKSEIAIGLRPGQVEELNRREPGWRSNGRWGMIQFQ